MSAATAVVDLSRRDQAPLAEAAEGQEPSGHGKADVTRPGMWLNRAASFRVTEQLGGAPLLFNPVLNRGTNWSLEQRRAMKVEGLLPPVHETLEKQAARVMCQLDAAANPLAQYRVLSQMMLTDTHLFYYVLIHNLERLAPIIYTPTVGEACTKFDRIFRTPTGMYLSAFHHRGRFAEVLKNWPNSNVQIIVLTDGSRILGLGDLGINGVGISIGKISLYVAGGGFHPEHSLPLVLDVGCNNSELCCDDPMYMGERRPRLEGDEYYQVVDELCAAIKRVFPQALLQFEDFETSKAFKILERQRDKMLCFNDDIQGTGAVVTSGFVNGMKFQKTDLAQARVVFYGAGSSAVGVAESIAMYMEQTAGISRQDARRRIFMVDSKGLITSHRGDKLPDHKVPFAQGEDVPNVKDLREVVALVKPHALIGLSGAGPSWGQGVIEELCKHTPAPLVFPLSNPTTKAEITAEQAYRWSGGRCVFASGSPFDPVTIDGTTYVPGQANNVFIFPGTGFGAVMAKARKVTDEMFVASSAALAACVSKEQLDHKQLYPKLADLRDVSAKVAAAVGKAAWDSGVSGLPMEPEDWLAYVREKMWEPTEADGGEQAEE